MNEYHYEVGDIVKLKKQHPCGSSEWEILRVGADFRLKCMGCGHQIMIARRLVEKNTRDLRKKVEKQFDRNIIVKAYLEARRNQVEAKREKERFEEEGVDYTQIDKTELLQQLVLLFRSEKDTKIKADLGMKIADLQQMKKEQTEQEEQIKYYLPLQCSRCKLYLQAKMSDNQ